MSVDFHFFIQDPQPIRIEELAAAAHAADEHLFVLRNHHDWTDYDLATEGVLEGDVVVCIVAAKQPDAAEVVAAIRNKNARVLQQAIQDRGLLACDLLVNEGPGWADEEEMAELEEVYGSEYVTYRDSSTFHYEGMGSAFLIDSLWAVFNLLAQLREGLCEDPQEGTFRIGRGPLE